MSKIDNSTTSIDTFYIEDVYSNSSYSESNKIRNSKKNSIEKIKKLQGIQIGFKKIYTHIKYLVSNIINDVLKPKNETINQKKEKLKYCIESLISSIHETISSFEEDVRPLFQLYIQEYKNGVPSYDIGNGSSDNEDSEFGNLNNLYPKRFDLYEIKNIYLDESINNLSSTMFYIPCFMILYDIEKIQLKIKYFWLDIDNNPDKKIFYLLQRKNTKWKVLEIIPQLEKMTDDNFNKKDLDDEIENKIIFNEDIFDLLNRINIFFKITSINIKFLKTRRLIYD